VVSAFLVDNRIVEFVPLRLPNRFVPCVMEEHSGEVLREARKEKVAFVPEAPFYADGPGANTMRLNFSYQSQLQSRKEFAG